MPSEVKKEFDKNLKKAAKEAEEKQKKFRESEKKLDENYKKVSQEEMDAEKYARLFLEDSTREYNPVEHQQEGGLMDQPHLNYMGAAKGKFIAKGCGKVMNDRRKKTKMY